MKNTKYKLAVDRKKEIVSKWKVIPPFRAIQIEKLGDFQAEYIRPDINFNLA